MDDDDYDWPDFPVILGFGTAHDLRDAEEPAPRLSGLRSVSQAGMMGLHKGRVHQHRGVGFVHHLVREPKRRTTG